MRPAVHLSSQSGGNFFLLERYVLIEIWGHHRGVSEELWISN